MNYEEAFKVIDDRVFAKAGRRLNQLEKIIIEAAWQDKDYKEITNLPCSVDHLRSNVGRKLWILLTGVLGNGEKVTKKRLRDILEKITPTPGDHSLSDISLRQSNPDKTLPHVLGGQPPDVSDFYGRQEELTKLRELIVKNRCVALIGVAGIGKSALAAKLISDIGADSESGFDCFIWKSVHYAPPLQRLVTDLIKLLAVTLVSEQELPESTQDKVSLLIENLQIRRCLLVLDGAEVWLQGDRNTSFNPYGEEYAEYGVFLRRIVEEKHQSCLVLTSREPFNDIKKFQRTRRASYSVKIEGLDIKAAKEILQAKGLSDEHRWEVLLGPYLGNPWAIELVASRIKDFFGGSVAKFLNFKISLISEVFREALAQQFCVSGRLTYLEKQILLYLAEKMVDLPSSSITLSKLVSDMQCLAKKQISISGVIEALDALNERSLIEVRKDKETKELFISLQPVVKKYILKNSVGVRGETIQMFGEHDHSLGFVM